MPLFEFTVEGPPLSSQTASRTALRAWKERVRTAAERVWRKGRRPLKKRLQIEVDYYHDGPGIRLDNDNMIKPIQDALNKLIYEDDRQITYTHISKTPFDDPVYVRGMSLVLAKAFNRGTEFIHVKIDAAPIYKRVS